MKKTISLANKIYKVGQPKEAIKLLENHLDFFPEDYPIAKLLSQFYREQKQLEKAIYWLKYSIKIDKQKKYTIENQTSNIPEVGMNEIELYITANLTDTDDDAIIPVFETEGFAKNIDELELQDYLEDSFIDNSLELISPIKINKKQESATINNTSTEVDEFTEFIDDFEEIYDLKTDEDLDFSDDHLDFEIDEELDINFKELDINSSVPDWVDIDIFDEDDELDEYINTDELADKLTAEERARQIASDIALEVDWTKTEMEVLVKILAHHKSHPKTRKALLDLIQERGAIADELLMLYELRFLWKTDGFNRCYTSIGTTEGWDNLAWVLGLDILRHVKASCADEAFLFIDDCFQDWNNDIGLITAYPIFTYYLQQIINLNNLSNIRSNYIIPLQYDSKIFYQTDDGRFYQFLKNGVSYPSDLQLQYLIENEEFGL